ncbi:hypothetical protein [Pseudomonas soli]|jgi:hypothetical protein|uniref:hypothetical protein n=1 Tax=Pseudomonas soli TaxID=1306993 RepID=UPI0028B1F839|nr:hypothetical protein [Pseudomonas soli]
MNDPVINPTQVTANSFEISIEEEIGGYIKVNGREYSLPVQLHAWAKYALECWLSTYQTKRALDNSSHPNFRIMSVKPNITIEHANGIVRKIYIAALRDENHKLQESISTSQYDNY